MALKQFVAFCIGIAVGGGIMYAYKKHVVTAKDNIIKELQGLIDRVEDKF